MRSLIACWIRRRRGGDREPDRSGATGEKVEGLCASLARGQPDRCKRLWGRSHRRVDCTAALHYWPRARPAAAAPFGPPCAWWRGRTLPGLTGKAVETMRQRGWVWWLPLSRGGYTGRVHQCRARQPARALALRRLSRAPRSRKKAGNWRAISLLYRFGRAHPFGGGRRALF